MNRGEMTNKCEKISTTLNNQRNEKQKIVFVIYLAEI